MSIKTLRKRIALVAVSALGVGLLSVTPASANYAVGEFSFPTASSVQNSGVCTSTNTDAYGTTVATAVNGSVVTIVGDGVTANDDVYISVSGPGVVESYTLAADANGVFASSGATVTSTTVTDTTTAVNDRLNIRLTGTGKVYVSFAVSATTDVLDVITITSVAACATTWDSTYSSYETATAEDATPDGEGQSTYTYVDADTAYISLVGKNAYNAALATGTWSVSSSNPEVLVDLSSTASAIVALSSTTDSIIAPGTNIYAAVAQKTSGTAQRSTITITYNGATVYSKQILITGDLAKITVSGVDVQAVGGNTLTGIFDVTAQDAAGNYLAWVVAGDSTKYNSQVTAVTGGTTAASAAGTLAAATYTCAATSGKATQRLLGVTNAGTVVASNDFEALCGSAAYTYTASLDKAAYNAGDIATLTITAKDASGFAPFKNETVDAAAGVPSIGGAQMTAINTPVAADVFDASGVKKYTFTVGSTSGKYNMAVNLGYTGNAAVSVPYTINSDGSISNAEVLASIVKLIAAINKQIRALQKSLRR